VITEEEYHGGEMIYGKEQRLLSDFKSNADQFKKIMRKVSSKRRLSV